jgi:hypothetical protein
MKRLLAILDDASLWTLILAYPIVAIGVLVLSVILFFFPIAPICMSLNIEFSNLGPIATFCWGVMFDIFVLTPAFLILLPLKIARVLRARRAERLEQQGE